MSQDDDFQDSLPKKTGMTTTTKVVLVMLSVGGLALLLCCGGLLASGWYLARQVQNSVSTNPVQIQQMTNQIVSIDVPDGYEPKQMMTMNIFGMNMKIANYGRSDDPQAMIMIMQNPTAFNANDEQQRKQMLDQMRLQMGMQGGTLTDVETREIEIDGQKVPFQFGKMDQQGRTLRQVIGLVPLKSGNVFIMAMIPEGLYDEDEIVAMLESIGEPKESAASTAGTAPSAPPRAPQEAELSHGDEDHGPAKSRPGIQPEVDSTKPDGGEAANAERPEPVATPE